MAEPSHPLVGFLPSNEHLCGGTVKLWAYFNTNPFALGRGVPQQRREEVFFCVRGDGWCRLNEVKPIVWTDAGAKRRTKVQTDQWEVDRRTDPAERVNARM